MKENRSKLHIIANCANRKRVPPETELKSISHTAAVEERATAWWKKLNAASAPNSQDGNLFQEDDGRIKVKNLYVGSYWATIRNLPQIAEVSGFDSSLWVISAGYGLISSDDQINSYSATFTPGNENSITNSEKEVTYRNKILRQWWNKISGFSLPNNSSPRKISQLLRENSNDKFLIVASADYLSAIEEDLLEGVSRLDSLDNILIITSKSFSNDKLQNNIVPADARLQCNSNCEGNCQTHLVPRGVRGTISAALAATIIKKAKETGFNAQTIKQFVEKRIKESPNLISFDRTRLNDDEVRKFINKESKALPSASCSFLLRKMRNEGLACEQKRFKSIYWATKGRMA